jgi:predicted alpha/beta-fold hydrolase
VEIPVDDGDRLVGFVDDGATTTVVYIFHGLSGSTDSSYIHRTAILAKRLGHTTFLLNHRGCGEGAGLAKGPYHSGRAEDLSAAIETGRKMFPKHRHIAIGFSMSGNALLLLVSGKRGRTKPDAAISVNAPIDLQRCAHLLAKGFNRVYDARFYLQCRRDILIAQHRVLKTAKIPRLTSLYEFDNLYTAPAGGFTNREDYYESCSTYRILNQIQTPTVIFTSHDDPFVPYESYAQAEVSNQVYLHAEKFGGHMGYLTKNKTPLGTQRWQDYALFETLKKIDNN